MVNVRNTNPFEIVDYTDELLLIPNQWGLINQMGLFAEEGVSQHTVQFDNTTGTLTLLKDQPRGVRNQYNTRDRGKLHAVPVPHFNLDDSIKPEDVQGKRRVGTANEVDTVANQRAKIMMRMRMNWAATMEYARAQALQGSVYAPNGTVSLNWYTEMGQVQKDVDFDFDDSSVFQIEKAEEVIAHIQDNIQSGEIVTSVVGLCSPEFFTRLIRHASVRDAFTYYQSTQEPQRNRLGTGVIRRFVYGGIEFVEYRGSFNGNRIIPAGEAYFVPMGTSDTFKTFYSPAHKFQYVNTLGEQQYMFEYDDGRDTEIVIETESNFLNVVRRPQAVVKGYWTPDNS